MTENHSGFWIIIYMQKSPSCSNKFSMGQHGFTIVELGVVAVIIAILSLIAFSVLPDNVKEARRAEGEAGMLSLTAAMQRYYLDNNTYGDTTGNTVAGVVNSSNPLVANYHADINSAYFTYKIVAPDAVSFTVQAVSTDSDSVGQKIVMLYTRGGTPAENWGVGGNDY